MRGASPRRRSPEHRAVVDLSGKVPLRGIGDKLAALKGASQQETFSSRKSRDVSVDTYTPNHTKASVLKSRLREQQAAVSGTINAASSRRYNTAHTMKKTTIQNKVGTKSKATLQDHTRAVAAGERAAAVRMGLKKTQSLGGGRIKACPTSISCDDM